MSADELVRMPFEDAFDRLEKIVRKLEGGDVNLAESLELFEEGVRLSRACAAKLDEAEGRVRKLIAAEDGAVFEEMDELPGAASS